MPNKLQAYAEQAERTARQITGSHLAWTAFLTTAARLYKYPYNEQLMIYMQRPEATACAEYDFWNEKMGRYVRRGSTGIALIDASGYKPRLKYVFDVSDTGGKENARRVNLWELRDEHTDNVRAIDGYVVKLDLPELRELVSLLRHSSNNLNQLTRRVHETGRVYAADMEDILQNQERIWQAANGILSRLAAIR